MAPAKSSEFFRARETKSSSLDVARGLYVLRYVAGAAEGPSPIATVAVPVEHRDSITLVSSPGLRPSELMGPGSALVVRAERAGRLDIVVRAVEEGGSLAASLRLESLVASVADPLESARGARRSAPESDAAPSLECLAHVAFRGDVLATDGEWLAGPDMPSTIEGFEIRRAAPDDLDIEYQALTRGREQAWSHWARPGQFVGSRGQSLALSGFRARLVGASARRFRIEAEALFLGATVVRHAGSEVEFVGARGNDPLVGLSLRLVRSQPISDARASAALPASAADARPSRVRIFRSSARASA